MKFSVRYFKKLVTENIWYIGAIFFSTIFLRVDVLMISLLEPAHIADQQVGYYSVAIKLVEVALYFGVIVLNSFLPLFVQNDEKATEKKSFTDKTMAFMVLFV